MPPCWRGDNLVTILNNDIDGGRYDLAGSIGATVAHTMADTVLQYQNYLEQVIGGMPAGLIVVDAERRVLSINRTMSEMLGV